jgi:hypothetical protein
MMIRHRSNIPCRRRLASHDARRVQLPALYLSQEPNRKKVFAMLLYPRTVDNRGKAIRRILIFDNHPDTLRLLQDLDPERARLSKFGVVLGWVLIIGSVLAIFWPVS